MRTHYSHDKDIDKLARDAIRTYGFAVIYRGPHRLLVRADGHKLSIPGSPSCHRAAANFRHDLRRFTAALE